MMRLRWSGALVAALTAILAGCGDGTTPVKGVVKLDGSPVEGASVSFVSDNGSDSYTGRTDAGGNFTMTGPNGKGGVKPGSYKVIVTKTGMTGEPMTPENMAAAKQGMMDAAKGGKAVEGAGKGPMAPMTPMGGPRPGGMMGGGRAPGVKTDLPVIYANAQSTPLTVTIPAKEPVVLDLKSK